MRWAGHLARVSCSDRGGGLGDSDLVPVRSISGWVPAICLGPWSLHSVVVVAVVAAAAVEQDALAPQVTQDKTGILGDAQSDGSCSSRARSRSVNTALCCILKVCPGLGTRPSSEHVSLWRTLHASHRKTYKGSSYVWVRMPAHGEGLFVLP